MTQVGFIIIGRNEGERLRRCIASLPSAEAIVYVDSGSTDGSQAWAREHGVAVVELSRDRPFAAARARNEGFHRLLSAAPAAKYVQFVDGDCEINGGWIATAVEYMEQHVNVGFVCGRLRERSPEESLYNRLCQMEWDGPTGDIAACGGIFLARRDCFAAVKGFNESLPAGEERELGVRVRQSGWRIVRLDEEMALHDAAMHSFGQWWRRQLRGGYGSLDVALRFNVPQFRRQVRRCRVWTLGWTALAVVWMLLGYWGAGIAGSLIGLLAALSVQALQALRLALRCRQPGLSLPDRALYGFFTVLSQWGQLRGHVRYWLEQRHGQQPRLIEHKSA